MLENYIICLPSVPGSLEEEWEQCRKNIDGILSTGNKPLKLNIFVDKPDNYSFQDIRETIFKSALKTFDNLCPAVNITFHPPEKPWKIAVEAGFIGTDNSVVSYRVWNSIPYVIRVSDTGKEIWAGGPGAGLFPEDAGKAARAAFDQMRAILDAEQMSFNHLVRQWNYIGNILQVNNKLQNYQIFNEVRNENYEKYRTVSGYPAATGVGMKESGVTLDFYAAKPDKTIKIIPVDNPEQVKPYTYGQKVLKGMPLNGTTKKQAPQFERAVLLTNNMSSTIFVSGTASILGEDTIGINDIDKQTIVTIKNINKLSEPERIGQLAGINIKDALKLILLRIYIKYQKDFLNVKTICEDRFPGVPTVYIEADICRDDLLVEIEAEFTMNNSVNY